MIRKFNIKSFKEPKPHITVSTKLINNAVCFSMGAGTDISPETYNNPIIYIGMGGSGYFTKNSDKTKNVFSLSAVYIAPETLSGAYAGEFGFTYLELFLKEDTKVTELIKSGEVFKLKDLVSYEEGSIVNLDIARNETMKFVIMAFDEGTGLSPHKAPGDAIVFALEGKAVIGYEGVDHNISEGECFRFSKEGLHSVSAVGRFKMALLLVLK